MGLLKMRSWSPDSDREDAWIRRQAAHRSRNGRPRSVSDDDLDDLRGCIDLGFGFDADSPATAIRQLSETLPALDLYFALHRGLRCSAAESPASSSSSSSSSSSLGSTASPDVGSPASFFSPGENVGERKARLKQWAQVVACSVRQHCR